ncbi:reticulon-2 isoform 2-T2 [Discoglossus pictus]
MGQVLSFTHCKDAPSTASSTPDSCPPNDDLDEPAVTQVDLWPLPSPQEPTFSYITIGSYAPLPRPPSRPRRGRGQSRGPPLRRSGSEPDEDVVTYLLEEACQLTQALPLRSHEQEEEEEEFVELAHPRIAEAKTVVGLTVCGVKDGGSGPRLPTVVGLTVCGVKDGGSGPRLPTVADLVYWRDTPLSAACLTGLTISLLCLIQFSVISVASYACLIILSATLTLRIYTKLLHSLKKGNDRNPFQSYLDAELTLTTKQLEALTARILTMGSHALVTLRALFLVEDVKDSLKFLLLLYLLTYVGAVLNGLTLLLLVVIGSFTFPILYKQHQNSRKHQKTTSQTKLVNSKKALPRR